MTVPACSIYKRHPDPARHMELGVPVGKEIGLAMQTRSSPPRLVTV
jgi:hypothetical protein